MDKQEAIRVLQALRPNTADATQPLFVEALVVVEHDPELKAWWQTQQAFDRKVATKLGEIPVPADLRANILARQKIRHYPWRHGIPDWLMAAAVIAFVLVAGSITKTSIASRPLVRTAYDAAVLPLLKNDAPALGMTSPDRDKIVAWLKERHAPTGGLPAKVASLPTVGCQKISVRGHSVSLICFTMADGHLAHIFIIDQKALSNPPTENVPEFNQVNGWSTAAWSDGRMSYLLATQAGPDALKQLL